MAGQNELTFPGHLCGVEQTSKSLPGRVCTLYFAFRGSALLVDLI